MMSTVTKTHTGALMQIEYVWLDGAKPTQELRSKTKVIPVPSVGKVAADDLEDWGFDGSSTFQAEGRDSDLTLKPIYVVTDPIRGAPNCIALCEVLEADGKTPHSTNRRALLRETLDRGGAKEEPWAGFEQEYTFMKGGRVLGWPDTGYPAPQGPFYCSVGSEVAYGRSLVEEHMTLCLAAGLTFYGVNAEVMPGQWEFQIGYRGVPGEACDVLTMADQTWIARYLLKLVSERHGVHVSFDVKPVKGDWNGAGMHSNFSTKSTRDPAKGLQAIDAAIAKLSQRHAEHIALYGAGNEERLTGHHETCSIHEFRHGIANRGCSIRIPRGVANKGYGYFEDRRPGANANPYDVGTMLVQTVCGSAL